MMRTWIGVALLALSWLPGLGYYWPASPLTSLAAVVAGAVLLGGSIDRSLPRRDAAIAVVLLLPAVWFAPWPLRAAPLLIVAGLAVELLPLSRRWPKLTGCGAVAAGVVMLAQAMTMALYTAGTARSHELPALLSKMLAGIARLLGIDAVADGSTIVMHSMRQVHRMAATWDLLVDPATLCFFVGGLAMIALAAWSRLPAGGRWKAWIAALRGLTLVLVVWLPLRAGVLMALYLHRALRSDYETPLHVMNQFLNPWVHLLLLIVPVLLAWRLVRLPRVGNRESGIGDRESGIGIKFASRSPIPDPRSPIPDPPYRIPPTAYRILSTASLVLLAVAIFTVAVEWDPIGPRKEGRVMVVERHSDWEWSDKPYDTKFFGHDAGYNYRAVYRYCSQFFKMSRLLEGDKIDADTLAKCDVLLIKTPTQRYSRNEIDAVAQFVEQGGGLLLVGEHTNFENCGTYMNDITRRMGFTFRHDLLFGVEDPYGQLYRAGRAPHPVVQHLAAMDFAISCSIAPGFSRGRAVIQASGLWNLPPDYHPDNYFPMPQHHPEMRYGAFIELWATRYGAGRVLAFGDSTIFSNFCIFQPGKAELMRDMLEWLNHGNPPLDPRPWLLILGLLPLAAGLWLARNCSAAWLLLLAAGMFGWVTASLAVAALGRWSMPVPDATSPIPRVVIDRTVSEAPLSKGAFVQGEEGQGYGLLEQWIPRLGYYTTRRSGPAAFSGDALVVICPSRSVSRKFREGLVEYVAAGGKLLVIDSPENSASTANSLLWPFGLAVRHDRIRSGTLKLAGDWPAVQLERVCQLTGGQQIARLDQQPVGATTRHGEGTVTAVGFGSLFNDANMGYAWTTKPDADMLRRYDVLFALLRAVVEDHPIIAPPPREDAP